MSDVSSQIFWPMFSIGRSRGLKYTTPLSAMDTPGSPSPVISGSAVTCFRFTRVASDDMKFHSWDEADSATTRGNGLKPAAQKPMTTSRVPPRSSPNDELLSHIRVYALWRVRVQRRISATEGRQWLMIKYRPQARPERSRYIVCCASVSPYICSHGRSSLTKFW